MTGFTCLAAPLLLFAANVAAAQPVPQSHEPHQAAAAPQAPAAAERCCCEEMMHKMMSEMMQMHRGMGMSQTHSDDHPKADEHQHQR